LAVAVPAWAGADGFVLRALGIAKEARDHADVAKKRAKRAKREANKALNRANRALGRIKKTKARAQQAQNAADRAQNAADNAQDSANEAEDAAEAAQAALAGTKTVSATAAGSVSADSADPVSLAGGPSVTLNVPQSGLIEVFAQATTDGGAVTLFEDGIQLPGQAEFCGSGTGALFAEIAGAGPHRARDPGRLRPRVRLHRRPRARSLPAQRGPAHLRAPLRGGVLVQRHGHLLRSRALGPAAALTRPAGRNPARSAI
jgi:hypothetical protein